MGKDDKKNNKKSINHNKSQHKDERSSNESCQSIAPLPMNYSPIYNHGRTQPTYLHFAPYGTSKPSLTCKTIINQE